VLIEPEGDGNSQILHYGGDNGDVSRYRQGTLYFSYNTVVSERASNTTLARLSDPGETGDFRNNIITTSGPLAMMVVDGTLRLSGNWIEAGWRDSFDGGFVGTIDDVGDNALGADPGFTDAAGHDLRPLPGAPIEGLAVPLAPEAAAHPVTLQYALHRAATERATTADAGAFE
jgi:hypothetical protein